MKQESFKNKSKSHPLISILIPCYNVEQYISQCLDSIINQTYSNLQIVIVDDGSKDNTLSIAKKFAKLDSRIEVYHQENQGVAITRNTLLYKIKGDYFLFVDSDDWIEPNMIEFLYSKIQEHNVEIAVCSNVINDATPKEEYREDIWNHDKTIKEFLRHVDFNGSLWNKLISTKLISKKTLFEKGISYGEDALFTWHILQNLYKICVTNKQLYHYRIHKDSLSTQKWTPQKKGTGSIVWKSICLDCKRLWPQYLNIAKTRYAIEDMWCLYFACLSGYQYDDEIRKRQNNIRKNLIKIFKSDISNYKIKVFSCLSTSSYNFSKFIFAKIV